MSGFLSVRLDPEFHGTAAVTTGARVLSLLSGMGLVGVAVYLALGSLYNGRFMPGVVVANRSLAGQTISEARSKLAADTAAYRIHLDVAGKPRQVLPSDLGASYDVSSTLAAAYGIGRSQDGLRGLLSLNSPHLRYAYRLDKSKIASFAKGVSEELGVSPKNATIVIKSGIPSVVPEETGWGVNERALQRALVISFAASSVNPVPVRAHAVPAAVVVSRITPALNITKKILASPLKLTYRDKVYTPDASLIGSWLAYDISPSGVELMPKIDPTRVKEYVNQISNQINIAPINQKVTVENGVSKISQVGVDGMAVDQDIMTKAVSTSLLEQKSLDYTIATKPIAFKTETTNSVSLDYGRYIEINLSQQHLWVYQDHQVILDSGITSGAAGAGLGTVTGLFSIYYKTTNTRLRGYQYGYNYDVPVKYWMPFYQGYGLHDAVWRDGKFGGQDYYYNGSHGCVNLPDATAEFIYKWAAIGTPVWVHK